MKQKRVKGMEVKEYGGVTVKGTVLTVLIWLIWVGITYYLFLPAANIHSLGMWLYLIVIVLAIPAIVLAIRNSALSIGKKRMNFDTGKLSRLPKIMFALAGVCVAIVILGFLVGLKIFHAKAYSSILPSQEFEFTEDIDQSNALSMIALMDTDSAILLGNREIGSLTELVSQYDVSESYSQIDMQGKPEKVSALGYAGFFKWLGNRTSGIPGYVKVDPVGQNADYISLEKGLHYAPSAYFNERIDRHLRFRYPTKIFGNLHFEVDEDGKPFYIASVYDFTIGLFGGDTVKGAIICDPVTGESNYYDVADIPTWVDVVFDGELLTTQYNWYGELGNGFWNSIFGKKGCKRCTETIQSEDEGYVADYGYVAKEGDVWIYTGVTSVNDDASNVGFILVNQRTAEAHYYVIAGADENSAMSSAEGEVQEKKYQASFPSLINVDEQPTYVMVLKDDSGIVKLYAMVNVEQYNIVTTAKTLDECFEKYRGLIGTGVPVADKEDKDDQDDLDGEDTDQPVEKLDAPEDVTIAVASIQYVDIAGDTYVYLEGADGTIYRQKFADNENLIAIRVGDTIAATVQKSQRGVYYLQKFEK